MYKQRIKKSIIMLLLGSFILSISACGNSKDSEIEERVLRIAQTGVYVSATAQIMKEKNILEKYLPENVKVEWNQIATGPDLRDAIVSQKVDIADFSLMTYILGYENSLPLTLLSFSGSTPIHIYSNDKNITFISEFDTNSKIAITNKSTNLHIAFLAYCKENLNNTMLYDNCLSPIPAADALASLETATDYTGAIFSFPMMIKANKIENLLLLADMTEVIRQYSIGDAFVVHSDYLKKNQDIIDAFLKAQEEVIAFIQDNPKEAAKILSDLYKVEQIEIETVLEKMPPAKEIVGYDKQAQLLYEAGLLKKEPTTFSNLPNYENIPK